MLSRRGFQSGTILVLCLILRPVSAGAQAQADAAPPDANFWHAAGGVAMTNWITWAYNWYIQRWPWANVGFQTWGHNLQQGFVWDNDCFLDNQFAHPYHGSMYHNSARASGYGFWSSIPFVAAGSATWELFGENIQASLNDLINTTFGGVALGEVTYRLSSALGANRGGNRAGLGRELGAFLASPIARTHGLLTGFKDDAATGNSIPQVPVSFLMGTHNGHPVVELAMQYGTPYSPDFARPYDAFEFRLQLRPGTDTVIRHLGVSGMLAREPLSRSRHGQLVFGVFQHYDYDEVPAIKTSGHSISAALLYQHVLNRRHRLNLSAHAEGLLLGGVSTDLGVYWKRDYDLGPGAGARLGAGFIRDQREWLRVDGRLLWLHSIHGTDGDHLMSFVRVGAALPVAGTVGVAGDVSLTTRYSRYRDFPAVRKQVPEVRGYLTWMP